MSSPDQVGPAAPVRADLPSPTKMLKGRTVYRVVWQLHTDVLVGYCWCGASHEDIDPIALWEWLLAHPDTHGDSRTDSDAPDPEPELVDV
ncbi:MULTISPECIES: hypothetical protein [Streptomyces]|uniref:Uncharacterized protein n=1 Tax=Streptomyces melanosporofaciens TaxID=67327 RepID=A0A1H4IA05_STRMJ|nr:hypothetical protein SAMN04490356_0322 [Streptomyces melanosporofaciens]